MLSEFRGRGRQRRAGAMKWLAALGAAAACAFPLMAAPLDELQTETASLGVYAPGGTVSRLYAPALSAGGDVYKSADRFLRDHADVFGVRPENLVLKTMADGMDVQPVMLDRATGKYKFIALYFGQVHEGMEVYGGELTLLFRNVADFPLVEAISNVRVLDNVQVPAEGLGATAAGAIKRSGMQPDDPADVRAVIYANADVEIAIPPTVALTYVVTTGDIRDGIAIGIDGTKRNGTHDVRRVFVDAATGAVLHSESLIHALDVEGNLSGWATPGVDPDTAGNPPAILVMPGVWIDIVGGNQGLTDLSGNYVIQHGGNEEVTVRSEMYGPSLTLGVHDESGPEILLEQSTTPPGPADFLHNDVRTEADTAEVNVMLHTSTVQSFVRNVNPSYPQLDRPFEAFVNVAQSCNAFYNGSSITFYHAQGSCPNMAYSSVIYHEYGHKLVADGAFGPSGDYHEGFADVTSQIISDDPITGRGFFGPGNDLRSGINDRMYPCSGGSHYCGQVLSGCVWELREELVITEPSDYREMVADLALNSVLLHSGGINPGITIDFLVLDDDDGDILNGTPHYDEIDTGFSRHNMAAPSIKYLDFDYPEGKPDLISPQGDTTMLVQVSGNLGEPEADTGLLHIDDGTGWIEVPMNYLGSHLYEAVFPSVMCPSEIQFYVSAGAQNGGRTRDPAAAPFESFHALGATGFDTLLADDFETDQGWTIESFNLSDGEWERGVPAGDGTRGDPLEDYDGSGSCYLTGNRKGESDVDGGPTRVVSPMFSLAGGDGLISFAHWFTNDQNDRDVLTVELSNDGGNIWRRVFQIARHDDWEHVRFLVSDYIEPSSVMMIRFVTSDNGNDSNTEAAVDAVLIEHVRCGPPDDLFLQVENLVSSGQVTITAKDATPGRFVYFGYGVSGLGERVVPRLNVTVGLDNPTLFGRAKANAKGVATIQRHVPEDADGMELWLQAAELDRVSNIVDEVVQ